MSVSQTYSMISHYFKASGDRKFIDWRIIMGFEHLDNKKELANVAINERNPFEHELQSQSKPAEVKAPEALAGNSLTKKFDPPLVSLAADALVAFGPAESKGAVVLDKAFGNFHFIARESDLRNSKILAIPAAAAALYSFKQDLGSLSKSSSWQETKHDSEALAADSLALAGAASAYIPKVKYFSTALELAGFTARVWIGNYAPEAVDRKNN